MDVATNSWLFDELRLGLISQRTMEDVAKVHQVLAEHGFEIVYQLGRWKAINSPRALLTFSNEVSAIMSEFTSCENSGSWNFAKEISVSNLVLDLTFIRFAMSVEIRPSKVP
eukprot:Gregarina_sp_Poly_1__5549@NODE_292_length_9900_cov_48_311299_g253_i0_p7_GENE_NODE_292_length_9900_cov_48_311299_g253_i0NODE_292_length_9900_cov_48_311299_g253_i0_p7_ORF_typecomplete_len112_score10_33DUF4321/PF14209_6/0_044Trehalose_PPase/PF02358_16/0_071Trehalose_PPase/PF02358_16/2e03_NODE_292_length_9900_cov_48_311299_g253_i027443079